MKEHFLWVEKYRPQKIDDCILPESLKKTFKDYVAQGELPHFLLCGTAGVGKTTIAKALCNELGADFYIINGSDEGRFLDTVRNQAKNFASTVSLSAESKHKVIIIDEADNTGNDVQLLLRANIEAFYNNCRFIFTCNYKARLIDAIHSRCSVIEFKIKNGNKVKMAAGFLKRIQHILDIEKVKYDNTVLVQIIQKHFPDYRRILNEMQRYSVSGKIDSGILVNMSEESFKSLIKLLKDKDFNEVREWVSKNSDSDTTSVCRELYDSAANTIEPNSVPQMVLILADYQYKAAFVADHELNIMAALTEIMCECEFL